MPGAAALRPAWPVSGLARTLALPIALLLLLLLVLVLLGVVLLLVLLLVLVRTTMVGNAAAAPRLLTLVLAVVGLARRVLRDLRYACVRECGSCPTIRLTPVPERRFCRRATRANVGAVGRHG